MDHMRQESMLELVIYIYNLNKQPKKSKKELIGHILSISTPMYSNKWK
jgi:hypothetical protein